MNQDQISVNGGREQIVTNSSPTLGRFLSNQYVDANRLNPLPTEWRVGGRPIYDRLPSASERYKLNFSYDSRVAYTYIPTGEGRTGSTSMYVQASGENKFLTIQGGKIVWEHGMITTTPVLIDIESVGMGSAQYLIAYQLYYDDSPIQAQYQVSGMPLSGFTLTTGSNTDSVLGWRYTPNYAFLGETERFWTNYDGLFPGYSQSAYLSWYLKLPCSFTEITLRCPQNTTHTGTATLSYSYSTDPDTPVWVFDSTVGIQKDADGQFFTFTLNNPCFCNGWKVEWSDSSISISNVFVSGVVTQEKVPASMYTNYGLVAYPKNSVPTKFTNSLGKDVPIIMCNLAHVDINSSYKVEKVQDIREIVYTRYEPIADWLTRTWDNNLINLYEQCSDFPTYWMNPQTAADSEYSNMLQYGIEVIADKCPSPVYQKYQVNP